jgi:hypothetical protein
MNHQKLNVETCKYCTIDKPEHKKMLPDFYYFYITTTVTNSNCWCKFINQLQTIMHLAKLARLFIAATIL